LAIALIEAPVSGGYFHSMLHHEDELTDRRFRRQRGLFVPERRELAVCRAA
jgi:hypothetical protein